MTDLHDSRENTFWGCRPEIWAGLLILCTTAIRLWFVRSGQMDLVQDESQYWDWSRTPQLSYFTKGPLIAYIIGFWTSIFGDTVLGVRFGAVFGSFLSQCVMFFGIARCFGRPRLALLTLVVMNTTLLFMASGLLMTTDNPLFTCWLVSMFALYEAGKDPGRTWPFVVLGVAMAVGTWGKYMMLAFAATAIIYGLLLRRRMLGGGEFWKKLFISMGAGAFVGLLPIMIWNITNDFAGVKHVTHLGGMAGKRAETFIRFDRFPDYFGAQIGLMLPWWFGMLVYGAVGGIKRLAGGTSRAAQAVPMEYRQLALLVAGFWPLAGFFFLWSFHTKINANWPAMSYASGMMFAALVWDYIWREIGGRHWKVWLWPAVGGVLTLVLLFHSWLPMPWRIEGRIPFSDKEINIENPILHLKGWEDLGREVAELRGSRFADPDKVFLFGSNYDITAALGFNVPGQERAYCVNTGRRLNQYDLWPGPQDKKGWDAIYVRQKFKGPPEAQVVPLFDKIEKIHYQSIHDGRPARRFTIYLCYGYSGEWPSGEGSGY